VTTTEAEEIKQRMNEMAEDLIEHGDAVVILLTYMADDEEGRYSRLISTGRGNHYTREGIAFDYAIGLANQDAHTTEPDTSE
jgi:hypothetical protein